MIHTFGDSHAGSGWRELENVVTHNLGAILCYSFGNENLKRCNISNFNNKNGDSVVFCFGEIDCRCHIKKHINNENTYQHIIDNIVSKYIEAIQLNIKECKVKLKNICIYNVVPPVEKHNTKENPKYPFLGSNQERKSYILYFNEQLKEKCYEHNWIFVDVYDKYCDGNGFLRKDLSDGNVHIKNPKFLKEFILKHIN
mgnify:CR=1 FL=1